MHLLCECVPGLRKAADSAKPKHKWGTPANALFELVKQVAMRSVYRIEIQCGYAVVSPRKILWRSSPVGHNCSGFGSVKHCVQSLKLRKLFTFIRLRKSHFHNVRLVENSLTAGSTPSHTKIFTWDSSRRNRNHWDWLNEPMKRRFFLHEWLDRQLTLPAIHEKMTH